MTDIFLPDGNGRASTRNSYRKLSQPFRKTKQGQNSLPLVPQPGINCLKVSNVVIT